MKAMIHKLSKAQKSVIASFLALVMVFGVFALIAPVEAQAVELNATSTAFSGGLVYSGNNGAKRFDSGAQIRVINHTRDGRNKSDAIYVTDGNDNWSPVDTDNYLVWQGVDANTFYGIYPATASYTEFTLPTDQSDVAKLAAADWMTDDHEEPKSDGFVTLDFQHRLTKVTVKIVQWNSEYADAEKVVSEPSIYSKGLELEAAYGDTVAITAKDNGGAIWATTTAEYEYTAIVMPAAYESTDTFFTFTVDGTPLTVSVGNNATLTEGLEAGKHYTFNLTVGSDGIVLSAVTVADYAGTIEVEGGVAELFGALTDSADIMLMSDVTLANCWEITEDLVIELNGHTITAEDDAFLMDLGSTLTISGAGTIYGSIQVFDGTVNLSGCTVDGVVYIDEDFDNTVNLTEGYVKTLSGAGKIFISGGHVDELLITDADVNITGGTFGFDPAEYLADGCTATYNETDNTWTVTQSN